MVELKNVYKSFGELKVLNDLNLIFEDSKLTAIIGRSGIGKSTTLNLIGALDKPTSGDVLYNGESILKYNEDELADFRNKNIGYIFQNFYLENSFKVIDNVTLPLVIAGIPKNERIDRARELLDYFQISDKENEITANLSGGEAQRVCIARALINNPSVILADEPTGNLDYENGQYVMQKLKEIAHKGKTVILVTHNEEDARKYADNIIYYTHEGIKIEKL